MCPRPGRAEGGGWCGEHRNEGYVQQEAGTGAFPSEVVPSQLGSAPRSCCGVSVAPILPGVILGGLGGLCCLEEPEGTKQHIRDSSRESPVVDTGLGYQHLPAMGEVLLSHPEHQQQQCECPGL